MRCPFCDNEDTSVIETRLASNENALRRRRQCEACSKRFTTYERMELEELRVIKKNGTKERFDIEKMKRGMNRALEKRPVEENQVQAAVDSIVRKLRASEMTEIPSKEIGNLVMRELRKTDKVAYVRFASVYKDFEDIDEFVKEIKKVSPKKAKITLKQN